MANEQTRGMTDFATGDSEGATGIRDRARDVVEQAKERATERIESKISSSTGRAAETLSGVARTLRASTQQLRDQNQDGASRAIERAADGVERFASYLQQTNVDDVVDQVHEFARRQPAAFIGGAFALGFIASRFLKATTPDDRRYLYGGTSGEGTGYGTTRYQSTYNTTRNYEGGGVSGEHGSVNRESRYASPDRVGGTDDGSR